MSAPVLLNLLNELSNLSIFLHGVISLPDATSCDNLLFCLLRLELQCVFVPVLFHYYYEILAESFDGCDCTC